MGYSHPEVHVSNYQGEITLTPLTKHYPPDTQAASLWLRNRQPQKWRDKHEHEHTHKRDVTELTRAEILELLLSATDEPRVIEHQPAPK
jgi:hypothetical protein